MDDFLFNVVFFREGRLRGAERKYRVGSSIDTQPVDNTMMGFVRALSNIAREQVPATYMYLTDLSRIRHEHARHHQLQEQSNVIL